MDVHSLTAVSYSDKEIVNITHMAAWFNYVNNITLGLVTQLTESLRGG